MQTGQRWLSVVVPLLAAAGCAGDRSPATFQQTLNVPAHVQSTLTCTPGTSVTVTGELTLSGLDARMVLSNNRKLTHSATEDLTAGAVLIPADHAVAIPAQTMQGTAIANPVVSIQFLDADGNPVGAETVLGPCAGTLDVDVPALVETTVALSVTASGCANHPGPTITVQGAVKFSGLQERLIVRDGDGGPIAGEVTTSADIVALKEGETISIPKQPVHGGVGGNPWIWLQLSDDSGTVLTDELLLGRCVQLAGGDEGDDEADDDAGQDD